LCLNLVMHSNLHVLKNHKTFLARLLLVGITIGYLFVPFQKPMLGLAHSLSHLVSNTSAAHSHDTASPHSHNSAQADHHHNQDPTQLSKYPKEVADHHSHEVLDFFSELLQPDDFQDLPEVVNMLTEFDKHIPPKLTSYCIMHQFGEKSFPLHRPMFQRNLGLEIITPPPDSLIS